jgi:hypothetical protein
VQENEVFFKLFFPENGRELLRLAKSTKAEFLLLDFLFQLFQKNFGGTMWPPRRRGSESNKADLHKPLEINCLWHRLCVDYKAFMLYVKDNFDRLYFIQFNPHLM